MSKYTENFPNLSTYDFDTIMCQLKQVCGADPSGLINAQFLSRPTTAKDIALLLYITYQLFQSQVELQKQFVELYKFVKDFFENLDLQEEVNKWLDEKLTDGSLESILTNAITTFVYSFDDLKTKISQGKTGFILANDIIFTESLKLDRINFALDLNGKTIKCDDNFTDDSLFYIGENEYEEAVTSPPEYYPKNIYNGIIDMNNKNAVVFKLRFMSHSTIRDLNIFNSNLGLFSYTVDFTTTNVGNSDFLSNITIRHNLDDSSGSSGIVFALGDSMCERLVVECFNVGIELHRKTTLTLSHFWGLPLASNNQNGVMKICIKVMSSENAIYGCVVDSCEKMVSGNDYSEENGGYFIYNRGNNNVFDSIYFLIHASTVSKPYLFGIIDQYGNGHDWTGGTIIKDCSTNDPRNNNGRNALAIPYCVVGEDKGNVILGKAFSKTDFYDVYNKNYIITSNVKNTSVGTFGTDINENEYSFAYNNAGALVGQYRNKNGKLISGAFINPFYYVVTSKSAVDSMIQSIQNLNFGNFPVITIFNDGSSCYPIYFNTIDLKFHKCSDDSVIE